MKKKFIFVCSIVCFFSYPVVYAESCTYQEAKLAFERGNAIRGFSLMNIAAKDGDKRASKYLSNRHFLQNDKMALAQVSKLK